MSNICMIFWDLQFGNYHQEFQSAELLHCSDCGCELTDMSAIPQGAFAACKVRENEEKFKRGFGFQQRTDKFSFNNCVNSSLSPLQYNSKLMNSIWGMYNRYSVHNLKKNIDDDFKLAANQQVQTVGSSADRATAAQKYSC